MLRPAKRPRRHGNHEKLLRRLPLRAIWGQLAGHADFDPRRQPLLLPRGHRLLPWRTVSASTPARVAPTATLRRHVEALETKRSKLVSKPEPRRPKYAGSKVVLRRRLRVGAALNASYCAYRAGEEGTDTRFIVTNLAGGRPKAALRGGLLSARLRGKSTIERILWKTHSPPDPHVPLQQGHRQSVPPGSCTPVCLLVCFWCFARRHAKALFGLGGIAKSWDIAFAISAREPFGRQSLPA